MSRKYDPNTGLYKEVVPGWRDALVVRDGAGVIWRSQVIKVADLDEPVTVIIDAEGRNVEANRDFAVAWNRAQEYRARAERAEQSAEHWRRQSEADAGIIDDLQDQLDGANRDLDALREDLDFAHRVASADRADAWNQFRQLRVVREVDAHAALGPQGREIAALIDRASKITLGEAEGLHAAWTPAWTPARVAARDAARGAAGYAARGAAWTPARVAARYAVWDAAWDAAEDAAQALVVRDLIGQHGLTQDHYDLLVAPWREVIGPVHPDDKELT